MSYSKKFKSPSEVRHKNSDRVKTLRKKTSQAVKGMRLSDEDASVVKSLIGLKDYRCEALLASDLKVRTKASTVLEKGLQAHRERLTNPEERTYIFGTFIDDIGFTSDRSPIVQIGALKEKVYRALRTLDLSALAVVEVHPLINYPASGDGRSLLFHVHVIAWCDGEFECSAAEEKLLASGAWRCSLGAEPIKFKPIGPESTDLSAVAHYCLKPPHAGKNRMPSKNRPGKFMLMDTTKGYRPEFALRVIEGLSQIELMDLIFATGEGKAMRQSIRSQLVAWHRERRVDENTVPSDFDIWRYWYDLRQNVGSDLYLPYRFAGVGGIVPRNRQVPKPKPKRRGSLPPRSVQKAHRKKCAERMRRRKAWRAT